MYRLGIHFDLADCVSGVNCPLGPTTVWLDIGFTDWCTGRWFRVTGFLNMARQAGLVVYQSHRHQVCFVGQSVCLTLRCP